MDLVSRRVSELLLNEQEKLGLTQFQISQKFDIPLQTYKRLVNPRNEHVVSLENLAKIWKNSDITFHDVFSGIYP